MAVPYVLSRIFEEPLAPEDRRILHEMDRVIKSVSVKNQFQIDRQQYIDDIRNEPYFAPMYEQKVQLAQSQKERLSNFSY